MEIINDSCAAGSSDLPRRCALLRLLGQFAAEGRAFMDESFGVLGIDGSGTRGAYAAAILNMSP